MHPLGAGFLLQTSPDKSKKKNTENLVTLTQMLCGLTPLFLVIIRLNFEHCTLIPFTKTVIPSIFLFFVQGQATSSNKGQQAHDSFPSLKHFSWTTNSMNGKNRENKKKASLLTKVCQIDFFLTSKVSFLLLKNRRL